MRFLQIILLLITLRSTWSRQQLFVGIIFSSDRDEAEIAFRTAIERANIYERSIELIPIVQYADTDDSFIIEKTVCNLIAQGVIAIFGPNTSGSSDIVASICNTLDIPHITYDWSPNENIEDRQHAEMTLNVFPDNLQLARGVAEIVQSFGWRSYTIVYETESDLQQLQDVLQISEPSSKRTTVRQLTSVTDHRPFLKNIKMSSDSCLILHCSPGNVVQILHQAHELKMLGEYQNIFIPLLDTHTLDLQEMQTVEANITTLRLMDPTDFHVKNIVHDWEEHEKREGRYYRVDATQVKTHMILLNDAVMVFIKGLSELGITEDLTPPKVNCRQNRSWPEGRRIIEFMKARSAEGTTARIDFNANGQRNFFTLRFMELTHSGFIDLAVWDPVNGLDLLTDVDASEKRVSEMIQNKTFIITSRIGAPFLTYREAKEGEILEGNARYEGYSMDLIDAIAKHLNFKYEFQLAPDGNYGSLDKVTQTWNGLVKELLNGNADLGICDLTMTSTRRQAVDFTPPFMTLGISILYAKPEEPKPNLFSFLSPFSLEVWLYMATSFLGVSLLLFVLARMAPADWENPHPCKEPEEVENVWTITNTTWLTMGSLMGQGCDILPKAASTRLVTGMWWFFALMMLNSYTANLAAFLTMSRMETSIKSAEDLAAQSKIKYGAVLDGSTMGFFKESNFSTYQRMWSAMESARPSVFTKNNDEGVDRVMKGKRLYAYLMESTTLEYIIERRCELMQVGGWLDYKTYGIAMPFYSPYRKKISGAVLKLGELGTLAELKRKWWKEMHGGGRCSQAAPAGSDTAKLDLQNVGGVFLVLGLGLLCAIILGIFEFLWNVKAVAIEQKITPWEALKVESLFALQFWITTKPVNASSTSSSSKSSSSSSSTSSSSSRSHSKRSLKSLGLSANLSVKSIKSNDDAIDASASSVHEKLRKIGSMFSLKSYRSTHTEPELVLDTANHNKVDQGTQMESIIDISKALMTIEDNHNHKQNQQQQEQESNQQPHSHQHHHHHHHHHNNREQQQHPQENRNRRSKVSVISGDASAV